MEDEKAGSGRENHQLQELRKLQEENVRLRTLSEVDGLTGLYNRTAAERRIDLLLRGHTEGSFLVLDVDCFKSINDRYGHLFGDDILREIAELIRRQFTGDAVTGRFGGDEFIVFCMDGRDSGQAVAKGEELISRMKELGERLGVEKGLTATIGVASSCEPDNYCSLFGRADYALMQGKKKKKARVYLYQNGRQEAEETGRELNASDRRRDEDVGIDRDMELIWMELREREQPVGAYCQDYETFKCIYRFVERGLIRVPSSAYTILLTLVDERKEYVDLQDREFLMEILGRTIQGSLRSGDVYTQYSSCQYLVMVLGTSLENAWKVVERIRKNYAETEKKYAVLVASNIRPLQSARR